MCLHYPRLIDKSDKFNFKVSSLSFRWTVPADFNAGMEIKGESRYETDDFIYELTGSVTLIDLE